VLGVDLGGPLDEVGLRAALAEHHLLLVRGQEVSDDDHLRLASVFGPIPSERSGRIGIVSNVRPDGVLGSDRATWHSDYMFFPQPYEAISLYGLDIPEGGTETSFANAVLAAHTLPDELRRRLADLQGRAVAALGGSLSDGIRYRTGRCDGVDPHQVRPLLWPHHASGEPILAIWHQQTDAVLQLAQEESVALLDELFAHLYQPAHVHVHRWQPHDLVLWDNHALQHSRPDVGVERPRSLRRVCVGQDQDLSVFTRGMA
jgi:alpha-ketoglutarate-dependent taurine dioxygenase